MKKTIKFYEKNVTLTDVLIKESVRSTRKGMLVHDEEDIFSDGDCIYFDIDTNSIKNSDDLEKLYTNEVSFSDVSLLKNIKEVQK